jgi:hypothetical protein
MRKVWGVFLWAAVAACSKSPTGLNPVPEALAQTQLEGRCGNDPNVLDCYIDENGNIVPTLINGQEVDMTKWKQIVVIKVGSSACTATVVGPKVLTTAAHCGATGATATWSFGGKGFSGKIERSDLYPGQDHDVSVIISETEMTKAEVGVYASIGGTASNGTEYYLLGYGCIQVGGGGGNDGKLRGGKARMTGTSGYDMVSGGDGQAALCFGDSGGPLLTADDPTKPTMLAIASKGNIRDKSYHARLDTQQSKDFLNRMATKYSVKICGVNGDEETCGKDDTPPPPPPQGCDETVRKQLIMKMGECLEVEVLLPTRQ